LIPKKADYWRLLVKFFNSPPNFYFVFGMAECEVDSGEKRGREKRIFGVWGVAREGRGDRFEEQFRILFVLSDGVLFLKPGDFSMCCRKGREEGKEGGKGEKKKVSS